ncbi:MAG TPA: hypothetical protein VK973_09700 [Arenicellales bacterium]|nr:hypothetical protein [Arenicellales bacterium]
MTARLLLASWLFLAGAHPSVAADAGTPRDEPSAVTVSLATWFSTGGSAWAHDASAVQPLFGNPTSRLEFDNVDADIIELRGRFNLPRDLFVELAYGAGNARGGRLTDADFVSALGARSLGTSVSGPHAYAETVSILDGDAVHYFDARIGRTLLRTRDRNSRLSLAARYLDWTEKYSARGVTQTICTAPGELCLPQGTIAFSGRQVLYNDARWRALFIALGGSHRFNDKVTLSGELAFSPLADLQSDDQHFLRADLARDPSFRLEGQGQAATVRLQGEYRLSPRLTAGLGVRWWWMEVRNESRGFTAFPAADAPFSSHLNRFESERYGITLSLSWAFGALN